MSDWRWMLTAAPDASTSDVAPRDSSPLLSFDISPGECVLVRGPSGSGKSTLLASLAGLIDVNRPGTGRGIPGRDVVNQLTVEGNIRIVAGRPAQGLARVGLLLQDPLTQAVMPRVGDDIAFGLENLGIDPDDMPARIRGALDAVGLDVALTALTDQLSGGERQRLALAGVLAMRPSLLLLDEPTANLDIEGAIRIRDAVAAAVREHNLTLIVVDHTPGFWTDVVTRTIDVELPDAPNLGHELAARPGWGAHARASSNERLTGFAAILARATNLSVGYPRAPRAQENLNFDVVAGRILTVTGRNGSGKSALALTLAQLIPARAGSINFAPVQPRIGLVFQTPDHQFIGSTVFSDVLAGTRGSRQDRDTRVRNTLAEFHLVGLAHRNPFALSGGEKRRLSIADVVASMTDVEPGILIFDEPSTGQDEHTWRDLVLSLRNLADAGHGLVVITHDQQLISAVSDGRLELSS